MKKLFKHTCIYIFRGTITSKRFNYIQLLQCIYIYIYNLVSKKFFFKKGVDNKQNCFMCICGSDWIGNLTDKQFLVFI